MGDNRALAALVLAAGESKRFRTATPKVLHDLCGRPLLAHVLDAVAAAKPGSTVVVTGRDADRVEAAALTMTKTPPAFARQPKLLGTAEAARVGLEAVDAATRDVLVVQGDTPLLEPKTLRRLVARHRRTKAAATLLTARLDDPAGYGRIVRAAGGQVLRIVEHADAGRTERAIDEVNAGVYVFDAGALRSALTRVERGNKQKELYLTDVIEILREKGERIEAVVASDATETMGVNSRAQLADVAAIMRARTNRKHMDAGVTIVDPAQTSIEPTVRIGQDTVIHPQTYLTGATRIGARCVIGPVARVHDSTIGGEATVRLSELNGATVGERATVGPFAYLRPGAVLKKGAKVGTFVEVKGSVIGEGSKVPHLSYVGDATIGKDVNVGAATVTVNYDGETRTKSRTTIGDGAKIGSDTMLVAPVKVGKGAVTGAGSVVTRDVPANTVVYGNPARPARKRKRSKEEA
jgi:bifunctional UDP-N-acetylglucosamine pyrophosphorylase/glucosamine-1-phosphate N-acetyltransferase